MSVSISTLKDEYETGEVKKIRRKIRYFIASAS
jgi:hypothetical protein